MKTKILYFAGLTDDEASEAFTKLETLAKNLGYVTTSGPGVGKGNWRAMLAAIAQDKLTVQPRP
jgi:hypothetical protein